MPVLEHDLELLEMHLDSALDAFEDKLIQSRLIAEPELALALDELRSERSMRQAVWRMMEPEQVVADRLTWRVQGAMVAQQTAPSRGWRQWNFARMGSAAVACLVLGFFVGRAGHPNQIVTPSVLQGSSPVAVNSNPSPAAPVANAGLLVPVTNEYGQVVAWQPFGNANDAKAFTEDLHRARGTSTGAPADVRLSSFEKF